MAEIVIDTPIMIPRRRGRRRADETIGAVDENAIADQAVNDIRAGLAQSGANEALDNVARSGGMPAATADDAIHNDRDLETGDRDLGPSRLTGLVDRERAATHDHTIGGQPDDADVASELDVTAEPAAFRLRNPGSGVANAFARKSLAGDLVGRFAPNETHGEENLRAMHMIPSSDFEIDDMNASHNAAQQYRRDLERMAASDAPISTGRQPDVDTTHEPTSKPSGPIVDARTGKPDSASPATQAREDHLGQDEATLAHAERRSRWMRALQALTGIFGTALTMGGAAVPGLAALGQVFHAGAGGFDPDAPLEEAHQEIALRQQGRDRAARQADEEADRAARADQLAFERGQAIAQGKRADLTAATNEENAQTMRLQQTANMERLGQQATREQQNFTRRYDPQSHTADLARERLRNAAERYAATVPGASIADWDDTMQAAGQAGAEDIENAITDIEQHTKDRVARRGRGTGPGGGAVTPEERAQLLADYSRLTGTEAGEAERLFQNSRHGNEQLRTEVRTLNRPRAGSRRGRATEGESLVPGWEIENAPVAASLTPQQLDKARETVASFERVSLYTQRMERLAREASAAQAAGARAGVQGRLMAEAAQLQEQVSNELRKIGGYGVPNGTELDRMEALAPRLVTINGLINARTTYPELRHILWLATQRTMSSQYGYRLSPRNPPPAAPERGAQ